MTLSCLIIFSPLRKKKGGGTSYSTVTQKSDRDWNVKPLEGLAPLEESTDQNNERCGDRFRRLKPSVPLRSAAEQFRRQDPGQATRARAPTVPLLGACLGQDAPPWGLFPNMRSGDNGACLGGWRSPW